MREREKEKEKEKRITLQEVHLVNYDFSLDVLLSSISRYPEAEIESKLIIKIMRPG